MSSQYGVGVHPDLPATLVHFTGRPRTDDPPPYAAGGPEERLVRILQTGQLLASSVYGSAGPVACFSEASTAALRVLLSTGATPRGPYAPWGVMIHRSQLLDAGGRPVWHMSDVELAATGDLPSAMRDRRVRFEPGQADWVHEREWRLCWGDGASSPAVLALDGLLAGVIVGERGWEPPPLVWREPPRVIGNPVTVTRTRFAGVCDGLPRLWWTGHELCEDGRFDIAQQMEHWDEVSQAEGIPAFPHSIGLW